MDSAETASSSSESASLRWLQLGLVLAILLPALLFAIVATQRHRQITAEFQEDSARLTAIVIEHALKLFDTNEVLLDRMAELIDGASDRQLRQREDYYHEKLKGLVAKLPQIQSVWVVGADGKPVLTNRFLPAPAIDLSDRAGFLWHQAGNSTPFVTGALLGKRTREVFFEITRRRSGADGAFAGTLQVSLYPRYLSDFYRELASNLPGASITLVKSDGSLIARWPQPLQPESRLDANSLLMQAIARGADRGTVQGPSPVDGVQRFGSFRKVGGYPLYAFVGIPQASINQAWKREMMLLAAVTVPIALALALAAWHALRTTRRAIRASQQLRRETEQRLRMEQTLRQAQKLEALGHLTGRVAHDFNNLLMIIELNAQMLQARSGAAVTEGPAGRLDAIQRAVATGAKLTRQLLSFSRRQPLLPKVVRLQEALMPICELCEQAIGGKVTLTLEVAPETPPVRIDQAEFELAMLNLAINARHAMPDGGRFSVNARPATDPAAPQARLVEVRVSDSGVGIAPEHLARVFEPFYTTKPVGEGTGLGLSQVYGMCARAGGTVAIDSTPGRGTTVVMRLPAAAEQAEAAPAPARERSAALALRVLLVEDNPEIATGIAEARRSLGCSVEHAASGDLAATILDRRGGDFDLLLSDVLMPGALDGIALARRTQASHPWLRIMLMTGYAERLDEAEALRLPVLSKPFNISDLELQLRDATARA